MKFVPLGDSSLLVEFDNAISEEINDKVISLLTSLQLNPFEGILDAVPAYSSIAVFYDVTHVRSSINDGISAFEKIKSYIEERLSYPTPKQNISEPDITIPVCYDHRYAPDMGLVSEHTHLTAEDIISRHLSSTYRIYMMGFLPGFPYMGILDERIHIPRKTKLSTVTSGSVAIAGNQTGIYPFDSPGGWHVIGRTPLPLFNKEKPEPVLLRAGQKVKFNSITYDEYQDYAGRIT